MQGFIPLDTLINDTGLLAARRRIFVDYPSSNTSIAQLPKNKPANFLVTNGLDVIKNFKNFSK